MTELRVSVVPRSVGSKALDRNRDGFDYRIDVAVQRKVEPTAGNLDALMELVEEIADHFRSHPLAGFPQARCTEVELLVITNTDGVLSVEEARVSVTIESCTPVPPVPPKPDPKPPGDGKLDPVGALGRIRFGNAGCTATVIGPRRPDGRWDVLTAAHCVSGVGARGTLTLKDGRSFGIRVVAFHKTPDVAWCVTDDEVKDLPYALIAEANPAVDTPVWHMGFGVDRPGNREDGTVAERENAQGRSRLAEIVTGDGSIVGSNIETAIVHGSQPSHFVSTGMHMLFPRPERIAIERLQAAVFGDLEEFQTAFFGAVRGIANRQHTIADPDGITLFHHRIRLGFRERVVRKQFSRTRIEPNPSHGRILLVRAMPDEDGFS
jgi:hypothetical protein